MIKSFADFVFQYNLKKKATSNIKLQQMLKRLGLHFKVSVFVRNGIFSTNSGILNLQHSKGSHWVCYIGDSYFDSYWCSPFKKSPNYI